MRRAEASRLKLRNELDQLGSENRWPSRLDELQGDICLHLSNFHQIGGGNRNASASASPAVNDHSTVGLNQLVKRPDGSLEGGPFVWPIP
jgi:hypothetical protein